MILGFVCVLLIVALARHTRSLSRSGALAALCVGTLAIAAGLDWGALLVAFFVSSTLLSRVGERVKSARTESVVAKGGERDAVQVIANGGIFALGALLWLATRSTAWMALGTGALAASASDTWSTEVGTLLGRTPRSILTWRPVPAGASGGVTATGTLAAIAGAAFIAALALVMHWPARVAVAAAVGGFVGSTCDSLLGATLQARRWCDRCNEFTERDVHRCGATTRPSGGVRWIDNDVVNLASSAAGALVALWVAR